MDNPLPSTVSAEVKTSSPKAFILSALAAVAVVGFALFAGRAVADGADYAAAQVPPNLGWLQKVIQFPARVLRYVYR